MVENLSPMLTRQIIGMGRQVYSIWGLYTVGHASGMSFMTCLMLTRLQAVGRAMGSL